MEKKEKKERAKCPVCGRFVRRELAEGYAALLSESERNKESLEKYVGGYMSAQKRIAELECELAALRSDYQQLSEVYDGLRRRGFLSRLFNKGV